WRWPLLLFATVHYVCATARFRLNLLPLDRRILPVALAWLLQVFHGARRIACGFPNHKMGVDLVFAVTLGAFHMSPQCGDRGARQFQSRHLDGSKRRNRDP